MFKKDQEILSGLQVCKLATFVDIQFNSPLCAGVLFQGCSFVNHLQGSGGACDNGLE